LKHMKKAPNNVQPVTKSTVIALNNINNKLREIQYVTNFLAVSICDFQDKYSEDIMWGARLCFDMIDERTETVLGLIDELTSEVKSI